MMTLVVVFYAKEDAVIECSMSEISNYAIPSFVFGLAAVAKGLWNKGLVKIEMTEDLETKFEILTKIHIWQWLLAARHTNPSDIYLNRIKLLLFYVWLG